MSHQCIVIFVLKVKLMSSLLQQSKSKRKQDKAIDHIQITCDALMDYTLVTVVSKRLRRLAKVATYFHQQWLVFPSYQMKYLLLWFLLSELVWQLDRNHYSSLPCKFVVQDCLIPCKQNKKGAFTIWLFPNQILKQKLHLLLETFSPYIPKQEIARFSEEKWFQIFWNWPVCLTWMLALKFGVTF